MRCLSYMPQPWTRAPMTNAQTPSPAKRSPKATPRPRPRTSAPIPDVSSAARFRPMLLELMAVVLALLVTVPSVAEQVHERTEQQQQIRGGAQYVAGVSGEQIHPEP